MSKKILALLIAVLMVVGMLPITALAVETEEPTKKEEVYQIGTAAQLLWFAQEVNSGNASISAVLTADIDLSDVKDWPGIGTSSKKFAGNFDGQGHTVTFKDTAVGLFGYIMGSKNVILTVKNTITEGTIKNSGFAMEAGFVHFTNCINRATITYYGSRVAGLVGLVDGVVEAGILAL